MRLSVPALLLATLLAASPSLAQTVISGKLTGRVTDASGAGVPNAVVTLRSPVTGVTRETTTSLSGVYALEFLVPGSYAMRVEAFGFSPVFVPTVRVAEGRAGTVDVTLNAALPPVTRIDTVAAPGTSLSRWSGTGPLVSRQDLSSERSLLGGWSSLSRFSSALDPSLGALGLPGMMSAMVVDGVPFFPARQPYLRGEDVQSPAFPAYFLSRASVLLSPGDVDWLGSAGATLAADTRSGGARASSGLAGSWSGAPLWSTSTLDLTKPSSLTSYRARGNVGFTLVPDTTQLFVAGDVLQQESPSQARVPAGLAPSLQGVDPSILKSLTGTSVERITRASGLARLDRWTGTSRLTLRVAAGHLNRTYQGDAPGSIGYGIGLPEKATDLSTALGLLSQSSNSLALELLGGVSVSDRTYGTAGGVPAAMLVGPGVSLGQAAGSYAKVSRVDLYLSPALDFAYGPGLLKVGVDLRGTRHSYDQTFAGGENLFFSDGAGLLAGDGVYTNGSSTASTFSTGLLGGFAQYVWDASPGLTVTLGGRVDREVMPKSGASLDTQWLTATGIRNNKYPKGFTQPGGLLSARWDVRNDGRTIVSASASVANGTLDPGLLHEVMAQDGAATVQRYVGSGISWPAASNGPAGTQSATILTILSPDIRAPRTEELRGSIVHDLGEGFSVHVSAAYRRTDFLARRSDLNLPAYPVATDAYGRAVYGSLQKIGSVVVATPGSNTRFPGFDAVWAINPDGWSTYKGVSVGLEYARGGTNAFVSYTNSRTRDNWIGAASGLPGATLDPNVPRPAGAAPWADGTSDFDVPNRLVAGLRYHFDVGRGVDLSATYTYHSGLPFTPGYRAGVDANGDGSALNDVAFVPSRTELGSLAGAWPCLTAQVGEFAARNSCRGPSSSTLNAGLRLGLLDLRGRTLYLTVEGFNLVEDRSGIVDSALLLVDPSKPLQRSGGTVTIPVTVNPDFGKVVLPFTRGRILSVGLSIGA